MVKYCAQPVNPTKSCRAKGADLRVSFKNTFETANVLRKMELSRAKAFLQNVIKHTECVPFRRFNGGIGRCAQAKQWKTSQGRWPEKSCRFLLDLLKNAESNAVFKGLEVDNLVVRHVAVHRACQMRRRTYRAHGRINPFMSTPCHVELIIEEKPDRVEKPDSKKKKKRVARKSSSFKPKKIQPRKTTYSARKRQEAKNIVASAEKGDSSVAVAGKPKSSKGKDSKAKAAPGKIVKKRTTRRDRRRKAVMARIGGKEGEEKKPVPKKAAPKKAAAKK